MNTHSFERPIGEMFSDESFKAFVYDFYQTLPGREDVPAIGEIFGEIFADEKVYRDFLYYCRQNNFSFVGIEGNVSPGIAISLGILQMFRGEVRERVQSLLHISQQEVYDTMMMESPAALRGKSKWIALQDMISLGVPVNSYGEVIYFIAHTEEGYKVYSDESGAHFVNMEGKVLCEMQEEKAAITREGRKIQNKQARREVLQTLQKFQRIQMIIDSQIIEDENDLLLSTLVRQAFEKETGGSWDSVAGDPKEENVYAMKFKSYIFFKILDLEKEFRRLQEEDNFARADIVLVGGTDMGD